MNFSTFFSGMDTAGNSQSFLDLRVLFHSVIPYWCDAELCTSIQDTNWSARVWLWHNQHRTVFERDTGEQHRMLLIVISRYLHHPKKVKSWEPAYLHALVTTKSIGIGVKIGSRSKSKGSGRQTATVGGSKLKRGRIGAQYKCSEWNNE